MPAPGLDAVSTAVVLLVVLLAIIVWTLPSTYRPEESKDEGWTGSKTNARVSAQVLVLGDVGRSPRMQYHAMSIAKHGGRVHLIGYPESDVHPDILASDSIRIVPLAAYPRRLQTSNKLLFLALAPVKVLWQVSSLYYALGYTSQASKWMIIQNPPSIPTLAVAWLVCLLRRTRLIIDWHNFGYSILALKLGAGHPLVGISRLYEKFFGRVAYQHITVTNAMARVLKERFGVQALALHDRPPTHYQPLVEPQRTELLRRLPETSSEADAILAGRTKLIVSSTSWTPDEDFSVFLEALVNYSTSAASQPALPKILAIITGKGPQKEGYQAQIAKLKTENKLESVEVKTAWLSIIDYAQLLGSADLGISLHTSSSGVDLPMKVVDMFGTGLPVFGWSEFEAWPELVKENENGKGFGSSEQLADLLIEYFSHDDKLQTLKKGAMAECAHRWDDEWNPTAGRLLGLVL